MDGTGDPQAALATGTRVVVRATGAPAVVVGPGQRAFKGLVKIRYPDRSTYHVELEDLELQTGAWQLLRTHGFKLAMAGMAISVLSIVSGWNRQNLWGSLWSPSALLPLLLGAKAMRGRKVPSVLHLSTSFLVAFLAWRLLHRKQLQRPVSGPGPGARSVESRPGSRLVKRCAKVPDAVVSFADFFGLECPKLPASSGDHMGLLHLPHLCYRQGFWQTPTMRDVSTSPAFTCEVGSIRLGLGLGFYSMFYFQLHPSPLPGLQTSRLCTWCPLPCLSCASQSCYATASAACPSCSVASAARN